MRLLLASFFQKPFFLVSSSIVLLGLSLEVSWIAWTAWTPFFYGLNRHSTAKIVQMAFFILCSWHVIAFIWLLDITHWGYLVGLAMVLSIIPALTWVFAKFLLPRSYALIGLLWVLQEQILEELPFGGVPWMVLSASQPLGTWQSAVVQIGGSSLLSAILIAYSAWLASTLHQRGKPMSLCLIFGGMALGLANFHFVPSSNDKQKPLKVAVVTGDVSLEDLANVKRYPAILENYQARASKLLEKERSDLLIFPETAWAGVLEKGETLLKLLDFAKEHSLDLLLGSNSHRLMPPDWKWFNSAYLLRSDAMSFQRYDKRQLVPFGEYTPAFLKKLGMKQAIPIHEYHEGRTKTVLHTSSANIGVLICFESLFTKLRPHFEQNQVDMFVVISNLQWLSQAGANRYLLLTRLKAAETRKPWLVVANGSVSASFFPSLWGMNERKIKGEQVLTVYQSQHVTPYGRYGLLLTLAILGGCVFVEFFARRNDFVQQTKV